jgi:flagellar biogenesis protein FliO
MRKESREILDSAIHMSTMLAIFFLFLCMIICLCWVVVKVFP